MSEERNGGMLMWTMQNRSKREGSDGMRERAGWVYAKKERWDFAEKKSGG